MRIPNADDITFRPAKPERSGMFQKYVIDRKTPLTEASVFGVYDTDMTEEELRKALRFIIYYRDQLIEQKR